MKTVNWKKHPALETRREACETESYVFNADQLFKNSWIVLFFTFWYSNAMKIVLLINKQGIKSNKNEPNDTKVNNPLLFAIASILMIHYMVCTLLTNKSIIFILLGYDK